MRSKEDAHDYRYFPDPDLPPLEVTDAMLSEAQRHLDEVMTPEKKRALYLAEHGRDGLTAYDAGVLTQSREVAAYFDDVVARLGGSSKLAANWVTGELSGALNRAGVEIGASPVSSASSRPSSSASWPPIRSRSRSTAPARKRPSMRSWARP
jgi:aspartyl-tRNA(Asn)/glutamyl-tRNA(Gln) amidotransferase subunit B